jgi:zinc protease
MIVGAARRISGLLWGGATACASATPRSAVPPPASTSSSVATPARDESFRAQPPAPDPPRPFVPPVARASTLPNGMGLLVLERHVTQVVAAQLVVRGGATAFPSESPEALKLMSDMTLHGTKTRNEGQVYDTMARRFFEVDISIRDGWFNFGLRAFSPSFFAGLELLHDVALQPLLAADTLELVRQRHKAYYELHADDPEEISLVNLYAAVFGDTNPYTRFEQNNLGELGKITRDDVVRVWRELMDPTETVLVVAGDVDAAAVRERVEALFNGWKHDPSMPARVPPPRPTPAAARVIVVDRPGASQATVVYGTGITAIDAPQHPHEIVLRALMGGMRSSTVKQRLREQVDSALSATARFRARPGGGVLWWQNDVPPQQAAVLLTALEAQVRGLRDPGPSREELAAVQMHMSRALPRDLDSIGEISERLAEISAYRLPLDDIGRLQAAIDAATPDNVRAVVPDPKSWKAIVIGDLASLRAPLLALGWGPLEERDAGGKVLRTIGP